ncbi:ileal sodium/bile acid cotransporter-like protein [Leptotrombidium deliense]|uniref:Ileal sodium/bile acid cotransporter-like protein n=1 Tax=Leptotrombidium deliense TaxID=299467 RepID=A0A443SLK6_9ACAR|nr:ileal sodium/bile acid cotransporter-like protein [Leptotrombidium deliense]
MCPFVVLTLLSSLLIFLLELVAAVTALSVNWNALNVTVKEEEIKSVPVLFDLRNETGVLQYHFTVDQPEIAELVGNDSISIEASKGMYNSSVNLKGKFVGFTYLNVRKIGRINERNSSSSRSLNEGNADVAKPLPVIVTLKQSRLSQIFTASVIGLVSLNYINMGCALEMSVVKSVLRKPIAPTVGFFTQYLIMPLTSYVVGYLLLPELYFRYGLFTFGCSPGGGASNMWTVLFSGNLNLSITMTFISTLCAVFVMPIWLFTLGRSIYEGTSTNIPFRNILTTLMSMTICLGIGLLFQKYLPRVAKVCRKILAPISVAMIIFIIIFGTYANLFMFKYMTWNILLSTALNVWIGFLVGVIFAAIFRLPLPDLIAVSIETGIQNTGVAIVLLRLSLQEPNSDLATVVPVAASLMTPIPLVAVLVFRKLQSCCAKSSKEHEPIDETKHESGDKILSNNTSTSTLMDPNKGSLYSSNSDLLYDLESSQKYINSVKT